MNQFTSTEALIWDTTNEIFMVTKHQEALAKQAARQWSAGIAAGCTCSVLSASERCCMWQSRSGYWWESAFSRQWWWATYHPSTHESQPLRSWKGSDDRACSAAIEQQRAVPAMPAALTLHCTTKHVSAEPHTVQHRLRLLWAVLTFSLLHLLSMEWRWNNCQSSYLY